MARFPSGITDLLPEPELEDLRIRATQLALAMDENPIGETAPCANPECSGPVDFLGSGPLPLYCSRTCRARAAKLRKNVTVQLELIERTLAETKGLHAIDRQAMRSRARLLRWWLVRLVPAKWGDEGS